MAQRNSWEDTLGDVLAPGDVIAGKFRIDRVIGRGGMGVVVQAWHLDFDERVAIKFLLPGAGANEEARSRFEREARATFKIKGEHVARVIDVGKTEGGLPFLVMEYLEGQDLADVLATKRTLPIGDAVDFILQACDAVAEAHAQGIVHRDLKPENLFVTQRPDGTPSIKVLDFGLSKVRGPTRERSLTTTDQLMGTPHYMSPEQWVSAQNVGPSADLWALAVILYELITGQPPFRGEKLSDICNQVLQAEPPPMALYRAEVPMALEAVLRACLQKEPEKRLANVGEFAVRLHLFANREGRLAAKRASGVLRTAGIQVDGSIPTLTIEPIKAANGGSDADLEELPTADLSADPSLAEQVRRAHAFLATADEAKSQSSPPRPPDAGAARAAARPPVHDERTAAPTLLLPEEERPKGLPSAIPPRPPSAPEARPPGPPRVLGSSPQAPTTKPVAPQLPPADSTEGVAPGASPWAAAPAPPAAGTAAPWSPANKSVDSFPSASPKDVATTLLLGTRREEGHRTPKLRQGRWLGLVIALAVAAAGLSVFLVTQTMKRPSGESEPSPVGTSATTPDIDPVSAVTATATVAATSPAPSGLATARTFDRARTATSVVGSATAPVPSSPKTDGEPKGKRNIPTAIE
jgi:serine/threonine protein kinase